MRKKLFSTLSVVWIVFLMVASCAWQPQTLYDNGVADEEYVSVAREHPDAQAFLEKYPQAETYVDRSGGIAVDFLVSKHPVTSTTQLWEGIRLRVFIDSSTNQPTETLLQCDNRIIESNVRQYLEKYFTTHTCP
jgi:hypothetical protein